ncbi:DUF1858 domain-containing protein [Pyramidobacter sp. SM-530-WT-4B]|uniref:DUF1858 domain-containing protein n=1 Tax=Pyramidobacter porci TaxID=2605789 RepID=A0A6L5YFD5_9BACT|nr:DUF1858 domain-containing protein [Pyramidobacter porci]MCI6260098.1 DUF1858 domain-containing protein [Pyramidobacter sp.]MDY2647866.1 DUF1858 domain-containing protein [Pyramidobacter porci]MST56397.1 DUF1858 domain-containing protein [Pyramidobacter porci]
MITKDMLIADIVDKYPQVVQPLMLSGMGCIGCAISHAESLEEGAMAHGLDPDDLVSGLNEVLKANGIED